MACQALDLYQRSQSRTILACLHLRCCWTRFSLAISNHARHHKIRIVHHSSKCDGQSIAQLSTLMDHSRRLRVDVAAQDKSATKLSCFTPLLANEQGKVHLPRMTSRDRELGDEIMEALVVAIVQPGVKPFHGTLEPQGSKSCRGSMAWAYDEHHAQGAFVLSQKVAQVRPHDDQARTGSPVAKQARLDMLQLQGRLEADVVFEKDHR